jgi:hypothetical protein
LKAVRIVPRVVAAAGLVVAAFSHAWLVNSARELRGGLLSFETGGEVWSNAELVAAARANDAQRASALFPYAGQVTLALGLAAAALLVASAFAASRAVTRAALVAHVLAAASSIAFVLAMPSGPAFGLSTGWAVLVFAIAAATGAFLSRARTTAAS